MRKHFYKFKNICTYVFFTDHKKGADFINNKYGLTEKMLLDLDRKFERNTAQARGETEADVNQPAAKRTTRKK